MATDAAGEPDEENADAVYERFLDRVRTIRNVENASGVLRWDQEVVMPEAGTPARAAQLSALSSVTHDLLTDEELGDLLARLEGADLDAERAAVVREVRREYDRATAVPRDLVERTSEATAEAHPVWRRAKDESDFERFAPALSELVELKREYAGHVAPDRPAYEPLFEEFEPYLGIDTADRVLRRLGEELPPMVEAIREAEADLATPFEGEYPAADQEALARDVLETLGYDFERGRLDTAPHPFSSGTQFDARVTTRFDESDPLGGLGATVHEFGHATYTLGLPDEDYATPLGEARDLTVHESQSRFWENHVGRTEPFWELVAPLVEEHLGVELDPREGYEAANRVYADNLIRIEADELTYHAHILARYDVERKLVGGEIDVAEVPAVWNDTYEEYLGIRPETDAEGVLQDIHWSHGSFGYFPTYTLGSVLAAQIDAAVREDVDVDGLVREGEFGPIHEWLTENVHRHGKRYTTPDLIEAATGEPLTADYFLEYVREKFSALYGVDL